MKSMTYVKIVTIGRMSKLIMPHPTVRPVARLGEQDELTESANNVYRVGANTSTNVQM